MTLFGEFLANNFWVISVWYFLMVTFTTLASTAGTVFVIYWMLRMLKNSDRQTEILESIHHATADRPPLPSAFKESNYVERRRREYLPGDPNPFQK